MVKEWLGAAREMGGHKVKDLNEGIPNFRLHSVAVNYRKMLLRAELPCREGRLNLRLGTKFSLRYIEKRTGNRKPVHITPSPDENLYFAIFDEDDVDFEIVTENVASMDRDVGFDLKVYGNTYEYVQEKHSRGFLSVLETNGRKFHFVKQSGPDGQALISKAAFQHGISYERAAVMVSQLKFSVQYGRPSIADVEMAIHVRTLTNRILTIGVRNDNTIESIKMKIRGKEGTPVDQQRLIYNGKQMEDRKTVRDYRIASNEVIHLVLRLSGGGWDSDSQNRNRGVGGICSADCDNHDTIRQSVDAHCRVYGSERGVICFGDKSTQQLSPQFFTPDRSIKVEPFVIEMRLASRYKLLEYTSSGPKVTFSKATDSEL